MSLVDMLRFNATDMFIKTFDSIADDYPIDNNNLLRQAAHYNNVTVFNHLISRMKIEATCVEFDVMFRYGNLYILQSYLAATGHRLLPQASSMRNLPLAIDSGNVEFVRLLLQHFTVVGDDEDNRIGLRHSLERRGIRLAMLRLLHEEFHILFDLTELWQAALLHSTRCNIIDSVQYILDNMPSRAQIHFPVQLLSKCLQKCAKSGNIDMFQSFISTSFGAEYLTNGRDIKNIIDAAKDNGQETFIKHLLQHHFGNGNISQSCENQVLNLLGLPRSASGSGPTNVSLATARLQLRPLTALHIENMAALETLIDQIDDLGPLMCQGMSHKMATFISSPRATPLNFKNSSLANMITAVGRKGSKITADIVLQFIANCNHQSPRSLDLAMRAAAGYSALVMKELYTRFNVPYQGVSKALESRCRETFEFLFQNASDTKYLDRHDAKVSAFIYVAHPSTSLSDVKLILNHLDYVRSCVRLCVCAASNPHVEVFEYVINQFTREQLNDKEIANIIYQALVKDRIDNVRLLERLFDHDKTKPLLRPTLETLNSMAEHNCYRTMEHYFNSKTFIDKSCVHQLGVLHSILKIGYQHDFPRLIMMCTDQIKLRTLSVHQFVKSKTLIDQGLHVYQAISSLSMETAFHTVFRDTKLGMMVMEQIGRVHKSLGINDKHLIKGSQLIDRHCLIDYIKYGATEWFLKYYSPSNVVGYIMQGGASTLLQVAMSKCDTRAVEVLLANPEIRLTDEQSRLIFKHISSCTHPQWETMFDQYASSLSTIELRESDMALVRHPSFLRKLIQHGAKLPLLHSQEYFDSMIGNNGWLNKQWALEMLQLMDQRLIISPYFHTHILDKSMEHNLAQVIQFYLGQDSNIVQRLLDAKNSDFNCCSLINLCCKHGRQDYLDILSNTIVRHEPESFRDLDDLRDYFTLAAQNGHLGMVERMHSHCMKAMAKDTCYRDSMDIVNQDLMSEVFEKGHLDVANFILTALSSQPDLPVEYNIDKIHPSIKSTDLIDRLKALPYINLSVSLQMPAEQPDANTPEDLKKAAEVGNVDNIRTILSKDTATRILNSSHLGSLIDRVGLPGSMVTEDLIIEFAKHLDQSEEQLEPKKLAKLLTSAASKSLTLIKLIMEQYSKDYYTNPNSAVHLMLGSQCFHMVVEACINRGDNEALEYLVQIAQRVCNKRLYYGMEDDHRFPDYIRLELFCNTSALNHLFDHGHISVDDVKSDALVHLIDRACENGRLDIIRVVHQRCTTPTQLKRHLPSMKAIYYASDSNHHKVLSYLFEGDVDVGVDGPLPRSQSAFQRSVIQMNMTMLLRVVRRHSCLNGNLRIINIPPRSV
ncbi:hypothetical protein SAMD00019534_024690 [Acytostelium subglobosum LB1]|uniref:hypothetical protein n=1 Tax=Acytostelium subglobosum LB1 TaxID=1410327 RepID=UPI00064486AA|nr:hypothetical protein SAMD00019534_024690 [Acytostelium subglobosum LB1]GAM19294.1 hypothetical protein SAMD00019534_024690 [Acytostelium subglobosum LB1]|eukprot:XP_012757221.1 hypothetical protein SAMD00019534_024690 [Acytostelium subglobosum LB1]